jgi:hypothetical protein
MVLQFVVDHVERVAESGARAHDLPPAIDAALNLEEGVFHIDIEVP